MNYSYNKEESFDSVRKCIVNNYNMSVDYLSNNKNNQHQHHNQEINFLLTRNKGAIYNSNNNSINSMNYSNKNNLSMKINNKSLIQKINYNFLLRMKNNNNPLSFKQHFNGTKARLLRSSSVVDNVFVPPSIQVDSVKVNENDNSINGNTNVYNQAVLKNQLNWGHNNRLSHINNNSIKILSKSSSDCMLLNNTVFPIVSSVKLK